MLTHDLIAQQLRPFLVLYPEAGHNGASLALLAGEWHDLLTEEDVQADEFVAAMRRVKKRCRFFPKIADVLEGVRDLREHPPQIDEAHRLPEPPPGGGISDEKRERVRRAIDIIRRQFTGPKEQRLHPEEARRQIKALGFV